MLFVESGPQFGPRGNTHRNKRKKKTSDEAEMAGGGAHVSKGCGGTGENMSLQM